MAAPNEVTFRLPRCHRSVPRARAALLAVLGDWGVDQEVLGNAELVLSELVTNALRVPVPSDRQVGVRVEAFAHRWGVEKRAGGVGKTVFAELKAPDIVAEPSVRDMAAVMVRPGHSKRVWGAWRTPDKGDRGALRQIIGTSHSPVVPASLLDEASQDVVFMDTVTRLEKGKSPAGLTRARRVGVTGERGTYVTPMEVSQYLNPVGYAHGAWVREHRVAERPTLSTS
ncbi:ATP-binding protein [Streptomyces sp. NPDC088350]|uniref:ATP-binding protein n=1 Tax=Streptomyces sp. NPDC088350 TaxID=3365854 RepID=UPI003808513A